MSTKMAVHPQADVHATVRMAKIPQALAFFVGPSSGPPLRERSIWPQAGTAFSSPGLFTLVL